MKHTVINAKWEKWCEHMLAKTVALPNVPTNRDRKMVRVTLGRTTAQSSYNTVGIDLKHGWCLCQ